MFVLNGASSEDFNLSNYDVMQTTLGKVFEKSNLKITGVCVHWCMCVFE